MVMLYPVPKYPHMLPVEAELWDRLLKIRRPPFIKLEYDVHVGELVEEPPGLPDYLKGMLQAVYRKRIDVVAYDSDCIYVVEVKPRAGLSAIGQVMAYKLLYQDEFKPMLPVEMRIVCERIATDIPRLAAELNIGIWQV
uniref:PD-(D/E)XK nuclease superfamily protein n=1 Tax=viral metagenome TaxID=1070528 RepID=A0A6H2A1H4_9ZZZZ